MSRRRSLEKLELPAGLRDGGVALGAHGRCELLTANCGGGGGAVCRTAGGKTP